MIESQSTGGVFYVDASRGNDAADGLAPTSAWRSLEKVNTAPLQGGDRVLFKRGDTWRGQLLPKSGREGEPIIYAAYGEGPKPLLLGSVAKDRKEDWQPEGNNIWVTGRMPIDKQVPVPEFVMGNWSVHAETPAKVRTQTIKSQPSGTLPHTQINCGQAGTSANHIQLHRGALPVKQGEICLFKFRARSTKPCSNVTVRLMKQAPPYGSYSTTMAPTLKIGTNWTDYSVKFIASVTADDGRITLFLGSALPAEAVFEFQPAALVRMPGVSSNHLSVDVGNIIFNQGKTFGVKKWKPADLKSPGDYWYDGENFLVKVYSERNPAELHQSIELALRRHIIDEGGKAYVVYENLDLRYGAAHGIGGASTHHIVVRNCDISWIGGGHQNTTPEGRPVRFGNGIEFWSNAHDNLVEDCRIWEIYDAALTNQGDNRNCQSNIVYRHNVIWNSEYSFEYWNGKDSAKTGVQQSSTHNIRFEYNTCFNAGFGWGHTQRPDRNGRHLMFYRNPVPTSGFIVRNNIFCGATESCLRMDTDWASSLDMDFNCWFQSSGLVAVFLKNKWNGEQFGNYQTTTRLDAHSLVADPKFENPDKLDFRLARGSPANRASDQQGPVGSAKRLTD
jgi:hypothetical protein